MLSKNINKGKIINSFMSDNLFIYSKYIWSSKFGIDTFMRIFLDRVKIAKFQH